MGRNGSYVTSGQQWGTWNAVYGQPDADGNPISGDVTAQILFWDAGTEVNQAPGIGPDTGINEQAFDQGETENGVVHLMDDGFTYPPIGEVIKVSIKPR